MDIHKNLAIEIFDLHSPTPCLCGGSHEVCLKCKICRKDLEDQLVDDLQNIAQYIDHTILKPDALRSEVKKLCREANENNFKSVCVNPTFVNIANFQVSDCLVCSVNGFPLGANHTTTKVFEAKKSIADGATEIDTVINQSMLKSKHYSDAEQDLEAVVKVCHKEKAIVKVILETCNLTKTEIIIACLIAKKAGADFVKTSTGFGSDGAKPDDVRLMRQIVGNKVGVKASGGIRTREDALAMLTAGANRIGASRSVQIVKK